MFFLAKKKHGNVKDDVLSGLTVALALVPEAVAFAFVAKVDPLVGLYAAAIVGLITSVFGGRPGMISGATGALAVVMTSLVVNHSVEYLFAAVVLMGIIQILFGVFRIAKFARLIPHPVMLGFVNGLAIIIFMAQFGQFKSLDPEATASAGSPVLQWLQGNEMFVMLGLVALTMAIIQYLPKLTRAIPASLAAIIVVTLITTLTPLGDSVRTVWDQLRDMTSSSTPDDMITLSGGLPIFHIPMVDFTLDNILIILPYSIILASIGIIESLMTLTLIDELTETRGRGDKECLAQGASNLTCGFFSAMGGCAMIGQSMINIKAGGRGRTSGVTAALGLFAIILVAAPLIESIPLAALVGVMFMVVLGTFEWTSFKVLRQAPKDDVFVMLLVTVVTVFTDLAIAVGVGIVASALLFAWKHAKEIHIKVVEEDDKHRRYDVNGPLFFASSTKFKNAFDPKSDPDDVIVDFLNSRVCDHSAVEALHSLAERYRNAGKTLHLRHLSRECSVLLEKMGDLVEVNVLEDPDYHLALDEDRLMPSLK
jgi:sulfate permease, SulP family